MQGNCSLVNKDNLCKCARKTKAAIKMGYVDPNNLQFANKHYAKIKEKVIGNDTTVQDIVVLRIQDLFRNNPYRIFDTKEFTDLMNII